MDKLNLNNLTKSNLRPAGDIDLNSICVATSNDIIQNFTSGDLIKTRNEKRKKLLEEYQNIYRVCLEKIKKQDPLFITDIIFEVPDIIYSNADYKSENCLEYIEKKLNDMYIDTYRLSSNSIFITWKFIELHKEKEQGKDKTNVSC